MISIDDMHFAMHSYDNTDDETVEMTMPMNHEAAWACRCSTHAGWLSSRSQGIHCSAIA
jgi:hypothetical protein